LFLNPICQTLLCLLYEVSFVENARKVNSKRFPNSSFYIFNIENTCYFKLGVSQNIERRFLDITNAMPFNTKIIKKIEIVKAYDFEEYIHNIFKDKFVQNEWFSLDFIDINTILKELELWQGQHIGQKTRKKQQLTLF